MLGSIYTNTGSTGSSGSGIIGPVGSSSLQETIKNNDKSVKKYKLVFIIIKIKN